LCCILAFDQILLSGLINQANYYYALFGRAHFQTDSQELEELFFYLHLCSKKWILPSKASLMKLFSKKCLIGLHKKIEKLELKHLEEAYQVDPYYT
jgi:hypothetical protein